MTFWFFEGKYRPTHKVVLITIYKNLKNYKEIKINTKLFLKQPKTITVLINFIVPFFLLGVGIGVLMSSPISSSTIIGLIVILWLEISFAILIRFYIKETNKYIYFPTSSRVAFVGKFTDEEINLFKNSVVWKKSETVKQMKKE